MTTLKIYWNFVLSSIRLLLVDPYGIWVLAIKAAGARQEAAVAEVHVVGTSFSDHCHIWVLDLSGYGFFFRKWPLKVLHAVAHQHLLEFFL